MWENIAKKYDVSEETVKFLYHHLNESKEHKYSSI
jgi:hypothetical protein